MPYHKRSQMSYSPFRNELDARGQIDYIASAVEKVRKAWEEFEPQITGEWVIRDDLIHFHWHETWRFGGKEDHYWSIPLETLWNLQGVLERVRAERSATVEQKRQVAEGVREERESEYDRYLIRQAKSRGLIPQDTETPQ